MADKEENSEFLRVRLLASFHWGENNRDYSENSVVDVPARWARTWERAKAAEVLGQGTPPAEPKPRRKPEPKPKRITLNGFQVDSMLAAIPTEAIRVKCIEECVLAGVGHFREASV